jgi:hypothetical protein
LPSSGGESPLDRFAISPGHQRKDDSFVTSSTGKRSRRTVVRSPRGRYWFVLQIRAWSGDRWRRLARTQ